MMLNDRSAVPIERRTLLRRGAATALAVAAGSSLLAACGEDSTRPTAHASAPPPPSKIRGTAVYLNYPGWIGPDNVSKFHAKYANARVKQTASGFDSLGGVAQTVAQNPKAYDMLLGDTVIAGQLAAGKLLLPVDEQNVPALSTVDPRARELFPEGMPLDSDTVGIGYRKDIVKEEIRGWDDFWRLAPSYSGKVVVSGIDRYALGCALIREGLDANSKDPADLAKAQAAMIELKRHVLAFKVSDLARPLQNGSAVMSMGLSYEVAAAMQKDPNIGWVFPEEGTIATIEGILGVAATDVPDVVRAFMDFEMQPENYADFIKETSAPHISKAVEPLLPNWLNGSIFEIPENATIIKFVGAEATKLYNTVWSQVQSA